MTREVVADRHVDISPDDQIRARRGLDDWLSKDADQPMPVGAENADATLAQGLDALRELSAGGKIREPPRETPIAAAPAKPSSPPALQYTVAFEDDNGKVEPGELAELTVRIRNEGPGPAEQVRLTLEKTDAETFIQGGAAVSLGSLAAGESRDASYTIFANMRFLKDKMRFHAVASEIRGKFGGSFPLDVAVNKPVKDI